MAPTATKPHSLRILAILLLSSRVQAFGRFHARDDIVGPSSGHHGWPGNVHGNGNGDGDDDGDAACSCPQPIAITSSSVPGFETGLPVQTVTTTVTVPGPTVTSPASTITIPGITVTIPGSMAPVTHPTPETVIITLFAGPSISVPASSGLLNEGLNGGDLGPSITTPASACGPQTVVETVFTTVTSTIA